LRSTHAAATGFVAEVYSKPCAGGALTCAAGGLAGGIGILACADEAWPLARGTGTPAWLAAALFGAA
jgi:hypothetical protein